MSKQEENTDSKGSVKKFPYKKDFLEVYEMAEE